MHARDEEMDGLGNASGGGHWRTSRQWHKAKDAPKVGTGGQAASGTRRGAQGPFFSMLSISPPIH